MNTRPTSTLVLPTLNEIEAVQVIIPQIKRDWVDEILCVDGGSTDGTVEFLRGQGLTVHSEQRGGYGKAMAYGLQQAKGDIVVEFTPDGNSIPADIPRIIAKASEGYDLVIGSRYYAGARSEDDDWLTALGNRLFTGIVNLLFRARYTDVLVGFRAFRRQQALALNLDEPGLGWPCQSSMRFARARLRVAEIPANEPHRIGGERKMRPFKTGWEIVKLILRDFAGFWPPKVT
jgi:glycosyltransferase involved in cell wall biosynthesis